MKKNIIIILICLLTINLVYADCKTEVKQKDYGLKNIESVILNIGEKIVKKLDNNKLDKLTDILGKIKTINKRQEGIINLLKDYFICENKNSNNPTTGYDSDKYIKSIHQNLNTNYKYIGGKKGALNQFNYIQNGEKRVYGVYFNDTIKNNLTLYKRTGPSWNNAEVCSNKDDWILTKVYIPAGISYFNILLTTKGQINNNTIQGNNSNTRLYYKFESDYGITTLDFNSLSTIKANSELITKGGSQAISSVGGRNFTSKDIPSNFNGGWLYIGIIGDNQLRYSSYNDAKGMRANLSISYKILDKNKYDNWKNTIQLKPNGDPIEKTKIIIKGRDCNNGNLTTETIINGDIDKKIFDNGNNTKAAGYWIRSGRKLKESNWNSPNGINSNNINVSRLKENCYKITGGYIIRYSSCNPKLDNNCLYNGTEEIREKIPSCLTTIINNDGTTSISNTICEKTTQYPNAEISPTTEKCCLNGVKKGSILGICN